MSTAFAVAGVSCVLQDLLEQGLKDHGVNDALEVNIDVTAVPADTVDTVNGLNVFLYQVTPNLGWRNESLPSRNVHSDRLTNQPLALDLHYLVSAYGADDFFSEILLGSAMQTLHEKPFLDRDAVRNILKPPPQGQPVNKIKEKLDVSGLADQFEQIKVTPEYLNNEEMSKLWSAIQSNYRPSVGYLATVVLIEAEEPLVSTLPVLVREVAVQPDLMLALPLLSEIEYEKQQVAGHLGETVSVKGVNLNGPNVRAKLRRLGTQQEDDFPLLTGAKDELVRFDLPSNATNWRAGIYQLSLIMDNAEGNPIESNRLSLTIAPSFNVVNIIRNPDDSVSVSITTSPEVHANQSVSLLLGQNEQPAEELTVPITDSLDFVFADMAAGDYWTRIRVDGVDSILIDREKTPPEFITNQKITVPL